MTMVVGDFITNGSLTVCRRLLLMFGSFAVLQCTASAGMPSALPEDLETYLRLNEEPHQRLQSISFFLLGIGVATVGVMALWNLLARDFRLLPRITFVKALSLVVLWGLLFVLALTMISGARELMTPGAWRKSGATYSLQEEANRPGNRGRPNANIDR